MLVVSYLYLRFFSLLAYVNYTPTPSLVPDFLLP